MAGVWGIARGWLRPVISDPQVRDSVDFGELLESREDREEDRKRK